MSEWSGEMPKLRGVYEFRCMENNHEPELVPVRMREGELWALMDGLWNPLMYYHYNLTDCLWRIKEEEPMFRDVSVVSTQDLVEELSLRLRLHGSIEGRQFTRAHEHLVGFTSIFKSQPPDPDSSLVSMEPVPALRMPFKISLKKRPPGNQPMEPEDRT